MMMKSVMVAAAMLGGAAAMVGGAADAATGPCGDGLFTTMRVSRLSPTGTLAGFEAAVRDHQAWYAAHGLSDDRFVTAPVLAGARGAAKPSATEFVTFHVYGGATEPVHDAAWAAYVAKYKANSVIAAETRFCLPKGAAIGR